MPSDAAFSSDPVVPLEPALEALPAEPEAAVRPVEPPAAGPKPPQPFVLRQPCLMSAAELRRLRMRHEEFARLLATRLSIHLRLEIGAQVAGLETCFYPQLLERLSNPTQVALFRMETLEGVGLIAVPPALGMAMVDRLLGGAGTPTALTRDMTEIEVALLDQVIELFLREWRQAVTTLPEGKATILGHETNPRFLQIGASDTAALVLTLEVQLPECTERIHLGLPYAMVEPVIEQLTPSPEGKSQAAAARATAVRWNPELGSLEVPVSVQWDGLEIAARKLAELKVGDVLPVPADRINRTAVRLARVQKFTGRLGKCGESWAIELLERI